MASFRHAPAVQSPTEADPASIFAARSMVTTRARCARSAPAAERAWVTPQHPTDEVLIAVPAGIERPDVQTRFLVPGHCRPREHRTAATTDLMLQVGRVRSAGLCRSRGRRRPPDRGHEPWNGWHQQELQSGRPPRRAGRRAYRWLSLPCRDNACCLCRRSTGNATLCGDACVGHETLEPLHIPHPPS